MSLTSKQVNTVKVMVAIFAFLSLISVRNHHNAVARAKAESRTHAVSRMIDTTTQPSGQGVVESKQKQNP